MKYIFIILTVLISGCGPKYEFVKNPDLVSGNYAKLIIYRPDGFFHKYNAEEPFVYLNDNKIGTLGVGETLETQIELGKNSIKMKANILNIPAYEIGVVEINAEELETYYVRYAYEYSHNVGVHSVGDSSLMQVSTSEGELRK